LDTCEKIVAKKKKKKSQGKEPQTLHEPKEFKGTFKN